MHTSFQNYNTQKMLNNLKWTLLSNHFENIPESITKRSSHTLSYVNGKLYVFGGEHEPRRPIDSNFLVYDLQSQKWSNLEPAKNSPIPPSRLGHSACVVGNHIYIFGGRTGIDEKETSLNDLYSYDTLTNAWTLVNDGELAGSPEKTSYQTMTSLGRKLYVFGGCFDAHGRLNKLYEFDIDSGKWTQLPSDERIVGRGGSVLVSYQNESESCLYVIAGFAGYELDDCFKFNLATKEWSMIEKLPRKLSVFACNSVSLGSFRLALHGGEVDPSTLGHKGAGEFTNETFLFDGSGWHTLDVEKNVTSTRGWHHGCSGGADRFYVYGGNLENNERTNELWCLSAD